MSDLLQYATVKIVMRVTPFVWLAFFASFILFGCNSPVTGPKPVNVARDLSNHPIYSSYVFDGSGKTINIGAQPLWIPTGHITEAMKRDQILRDSLADIGLKLKFFPFLKGDDVNYFVKRGKLDVGIVGDMPVLTIASAMKVTVPSLIQLGFTSIVANRHELLPNLSNKRIGYAFGSNAHYALLNALAREGIEEGDVKLVAMDIVDMPSSLLDGKIFAFSAWEPTPTIAMILNAKATVISRSQSSGYMYFTKKFANEHPAAMRLLAAAEIRAIRWMQKDRKNLVQAGTWSREAGEKLSGYKSKLSVRDYSKLAVQDIIGISSLPNIPKEFLEDQGQLSKEFEFLKTLGKISPSIKWEVVKTSFDTRIVTEIVGEQDKYRLNEFNFKELN